MTAFVVSGCAVDSRHPVGPAILTDGKEYYQPQEGFVPDEVTAIRIAEAVFVVAYGEQRLDKEKPLEAHLYNNIWTVLGSVDCQNKYPCDQLSMGIRKDSGEILSVSRGEE